MIIPVKLSYGPYGQQGAALFISLVILIVITLIGMSSIQTTVLEQKMAGNLHRSNIAFQAAEAALSECESQLRVPPEEPRPHDTDIPCNGSKKNANGKDLAVWALNAAGVDCPKKPKKEPDSSTSSEPWWNTRDAAWWKNSEKNNLVYSYPDPIMGLEKNQYPLCLIEHYGKFPPHSDYNWEDQRDQQDTFDYYRITARSTAGDNEQARAILQSTTAWQYRR